MSNLLLFLAFAGLMGAVRTFTAAGGSASTAAAFGYLLLSGFFGGRLFAQLRLPKLTGYLAAGIVAGPYVFNLVPRAALDNLSVFNGVATALIALTAGLELHFKSIRSLLRPVLWISLVGVSLGAVLIAATVFLVRARLPFMEGMNPTQTAVICAILGIVMVAQSPAVVVALRDETNADGPVVRTVLGVVVIGDMLVILLFAGASILTKSVLGAAANPLDALLSIAWELLGSLAIGAVVGVLLAAALRFARSSAGLFVLTTCFVVAEIGRRVHLDPLLVALAAGLLVRNATSYGEHLHEGIEQSSLPVYVVFFAITGAGIHLDVLATVGTAALAIVAARAAGLLGGARLGARLGGADPSVKRYAGFGLLPQAGLALALALLFRRTFPEFGAEAGALTLGVVAINEIVAPAIYRFAILRAGEANAGPPESVGEPSADRTPMPTHESPTHE